MGDKIEFPFNDRMYFEQAVEAIERNDFETALEYIEKVYVNDKGTVVNHFYTLTLYTLERFEEALDIADKQKDFYYQNEKYTVLYTTILIKNHLFLEAEVLIQDHIENTHSMYFSDWKKLKEELNLERELVKLKLEREKKATKRELIELESYSPMKQAEIIGKAEELVLEDLQETARIIFANPHVTGMTKRAFLELLIKKQDTNDYVFPWFNQQKEIVPEQLDVFEQHPIVKQVNQHLETKVQKIPSLFEVINVEIMNDLLMLYPFMEEVITDIDYWVDAYIDYFDTTNQLKTETSSQTTKQEEMDQWMDRLDQMAQRKTPRT